MSHRTRWIAATSAATESLLFVGATTLVELVDRLFRRADIRHAEKPLPIIYLLTTNTTSSPLVGLDDRFSQIRRSVTARLSADVVRATIADVLNHVVADLATKVRGVARIRFPHYSLAVWLATLGATDGAETLPDRMDRVVDAQLNELIKKRFPVTGDSGDNADLVEEFPWYVRALARMRGRFAMAAMRLFWRPPRWLARQHEIGKRHATSFRAVARAFMTNQDEKVGDYPVAQLLVDAFLEDLRRAYRRTTLFGRGRRRTAYPVLFLDVIGGPGDCAAELLDRIAKARDMAGQRVRRPTPYRVDPLLVIAAGPDSGRETEPRVDSVADAWTAYDGWLRDMRQARNRDWLLPLRVTGSDADGMRDSVARVPLARIRVSRTAPVVLTAVLLGALLVTVDREYSHCGTWYWQSNLDREGGQCVGLAPPGYRFFDDFANVADLPEKARKDLQGVENRIQNANEEIVNGEGRYLTVVYLSNLSPHSAAAYNSELEQLRGIEIAQNDERQIMPIRVLLANAGDGMEYGRAAAESIVAEAHADHTLLGVLGLGISREGTREAMIRLGEERIPMIGTFISATELAEDTSEYYRQVGPTNRRESAVAAQYAKAALGVTKAHIYYAGDPTDLYSVDLRDRFRDAFSGVGIEVDATPYRRAPGDPGADVEELGREACDIGGDAVALYAGRAEQIEAFLNGMKGGCEGRYPKVISGDDATRFVLANGVARYPGLTLDYMSFGSSLAWEDCESASKINGFLIGYAQSYGETCERTQDGSAILAFDSMKVFKQAVLSAPLDNEGMPTLDGVLAGLNSIGESKALSGAGGVIDFGRGESVPVDKAVMILRADGGEPHRVLLCGTIPTAPPEPDKSRCPTDER